MVYLIYAILFSIKFLGEKELENLQIEKKKFIELLNTINLIEVKGESNILYMYQIMAFLKNEIIEIDKKIQSQGG